MITGPPPKFHGTRNILRELVGVSLFWLVEKVPADLPGSALASEDEYLAVGFLALLTGRVDGLDTVAAGKRIGDRLTGHDELVDRESHRKLDVPEDIGVAVR
jgi:hypothetical protein